MFLCYPKGQGSQRHRHLQGHPEGQPSSAQHLKACVFNLCCSICLLCLFFCFVLFCYVCFVCCLVMPSSSSPVFCRRRVFMTLAVRLNGGSSMASWLSTSMLAGLRGVTTLLSSTMVSAGMASHQASHCLELAWWAAGQLHQAAAECSAASCQHKHI